jgi:hypothetical protein
MPPSFACANARFFLIHFLVNLRQRMRQPVGSDGMRWLPYCTSLAPHSPTAFRSASDLCIESPVDCQMNGQAKAVLAPFATSNAWQCILTCIHNADEPFCQLNSLDIFVGSLHDLVETG